MSLYVENNYFKIPEKEPEFVKIKGKTEAEARQNSQVIAYEQIKIIFKNYLSDAEKERVLKKIKSYEIEEENSRSMLAKAIGLCFGVAPLAGGPIAVGLAGGATAIWTTHHLENKRQKRDVKAEEVGKIVIPKLLAAAKKLTYLKKMPLSDQEAKKNYEALKKDDQKREREYYDAYEMYQKLYDAGYRIL